VPLDAHGRRPDKAWHQEVAQILYVGVVGGGWRWRVSAAY
jgi:hypothetical protein